MAGRGGEEPTVLHLAKRADFDRAMSEFASADTVLLGMLLYTDSMPALVAAFIEALEPLVGRAGNPRIGFLVQSGFSETLHSRGLERYLAKLVVRLGSPYAGTIVKGGGESLQAIPDEALGSLFGLATLGTHDSAFGRASNLTHARALTGRDSLATAFAAAGKPEKVGAIGPLTMRIGALLMPVAKESLEMPYEFTEPFVVDSSAIEREFGLSVTPPAEGMTRTVEWYRRR